MSKQITAEEILNRKLHAVEGMGKYDKFIRNLYLEAMEEYASQFSSQEVKQSVNVITDEQIKNLKSYHKELGIYLMGEDISHHDFAELSERLLPNLFDALIPILNIYKEREPEKVEAKPGAENDFIKYIKDERLNISKALLDKWLMHTPQERVAIENLLIAYDQMVDRFVSTESPDSDKKAENTDKGLGFCLEKDCNKFAVTDYNGCKHYVCQGHYDSLTRCFEDEYN